MVQGNKRTPDKFVGKEAVITSQCLNGWLVVIGFFFAVLGLFGSEVLQLRALCRYLVKAVDSGESVRLQYRSLKKAADSGRDEIAAVGPGIPAQETMKGAGR
jgi:hypothetical protein